MYAHTYCSWVPLPTIGLHKVKVEKKEITVMQEKVIKEEEKIFIKKAEM